MSLGLEVLLELLLDFIKDLIIGRQVVIQVSVLLDGTHDVWEPVDLHHKLFEALVDAIELGRLLSKLPSDVSCGKNVLKIHPLLLKKDPAVKNLRESHQVFLPHFRICADGFDVAGTQDHVDRGHSLI